MHRDMSRSWLASVVPALVAVGVLAAAAALAASQKSQPSAAAAVAPAVAFEFRAMLADGRPFADLRPEDVDF